MRSNSIVWTLALLFFFIGVWTIQQVGQHDSSIAPIHQRVLGTTSSAPAAPSTCHEHAGLPDPTCTPGSIDPRVTQANIHSTICVNGYTKTVRPPVSYTNSLKKEQIKDYGYTDTNLKDYEEDHEIPLEVGGNPTDPKNLWPEPGSSPNSKDSVENVCNEKVCNGQISLARAQKEIAANWQTACQ